MRRAFGLLGLLLPSWAYGQTVSIHSDRNDIYAGLPFVLSIEAKGFDENPQPEAPALAIPHARITYLGPSSSVSSMVTIINGQMTQRRDVTLVFRYRVEVPTPGVYTIPSVVIEQGGKRAASQPTTFQVGEIESTQEMRLALLLPERPLWVGETFDVTLEWYLRRDVNDRNFVIPLFDATEWLDVQPAPGGSETLNFPAGAKEVSLPYQRDQALLDGGQYTRFRFAARVTALKAGTLDLPPARVVAQLQVGRGRDAFGFRVPQTMLFKAEDQPRKLEIRALPLTGRPASFQNAVGSDFSIESLADRTVVRVGDPMELRVTIRGKGRLEGLGLGDLGLPPEHFVVPEEKPAGEIIESGSAKVFRLPVRIRSAEAREIPPLSFSYFDPAVGQYQTVRGQAIALSVSGAATVGAQDVQSEKGQPQAPLAQGQETALLSLSGADLGLSEESQTLKTILSLRQVRPYLGMLYGVPILALALTLWRRRTRARRELRAELREAIRTLQKELKAAGKLPARESAPRLSRALTALARQLELPAPAEMTQRLETEAYRPDAGSQPLDRALLDEVTKLSKTWTRQPRQDARAISAVSLLCVLGIGASVLARTTNPELAEARAAYKNALSLRAVDKRAASFAHAERLFSALVQKYSDRPELLTDWGNTAVGAQELGNATLGYRRALQLDPGLRRARQNLVWVRRQQPDWLPKPKTAGAIESLFFWHERLSAAHKHLIAATGFFLAMLLLLPRKALLRRLGFVPATLWAAMILSLVFERNASADAVIITDDVILRSADSVGAPPAFGKPLPQGTEVSIAETHEDWLRVELADGTRGWLPQTTAEKIGDRIPPAKLLKDKGN